MRLVSAEQGVPAAAAVVMADSPEITDAASRAVVRLWVVDAFTDRPFAGNPAGVILLEGESWPAEGWMRQVAAELGLSQTAFAHRLPAGAAAHWALRWFTPLVEDDLCGHATLATAHVLAGVAAAGRGEDVRAPVVRFATRSGVLSARVDAAGVITLDFPAAPPVAVQAPPGLAAALGVAPQSVHATGALRDLVVVLPNEGAVRAARPDLGAVAALTRRENLRAITLTAAAEPGAGYDFVSRFFSPADGIPEDPVTGSAHTALGPYWSARLGRLSLIGHQASARSGMVETTVEGDRVHLSGRAVTVLQGRWQVPPP